MNATELIITGTLAAIMTTAGLQELSPEATEVSREIQEIAKAQDRKWALVEEITGRPVAPVSPISTEEIAEIAREIRSRGISPEEAAAAEAAIARFDGQDGF